MTSRPPLRPSALLAGALVALGLLAPGAARALNRLQAPEQLPLPATVSPLDVAAGDIEGDGVAEIAVYGSDRRVHVFHRVNGAWSQAFESSIGQPPTGSPLHYPRVHFDGSGLAGPGPGYHGGQFLYQCKTPGYEVVSIRRDLGGTWSELSLFGMLAFVGNDGEFGGPVTIGAAGMSPSGRLLIPGGDLFDPPSRVWLPEFATSPPYPAIVRNSDIHGYCQQMSSWTPSVAGGDFNGDGHVELAMLRANEVHIADTDGAPNGGNTGCWPVQILPIAGPDLMLVGHLDGGSTDDLLFRVGDGTLILWLGNPGAPPFAFSTATHATSAPTGAVSSDVVTADVDGDGDLDVVQGFSSPPGYEVLLNDGGATLTGTFFGLDAGTGPVSALATTDADGDGHLDLVLTQAEATYPRVLILPGHGDGTFGLPAGTGLGWLEPTAILTTDLDDDGAPDVVVGGRDQDLAGGVQPLHVFHNTGGGVFAPPQIVDAYGLEGTDGIWQLSTYVDPPSLGGARWITATQMTRLGLAQSYGDGTLLSMGMSFYNSYNTLGADHADLDGDGTIDEAVLYIDWHSDTHLDVSSASPGISLTVAGIAFGPRAVDWNGDGRLDLAVVRWEVPTLDVYLQAAGSPLSFPTVVHIPLDVTVGYPYAQPDPFEILTMGGTSRSIAILGYDPGDGSPRLDVIANTAPIVTRQVIELSGEMNGIPTQLAAGDLDGDGLPDLAAIVNSDGAPEAALMVLRGQPGSPISFQRGEDYVFPGQRLRGIACADLDGDTRTDVVTSTLDALLFPAPNRARPASVSALGSGSFLPVRSIPALSGTGAVSPTPGVVPATLAMSVAPNPLRGSSAMVSYALPRAGHVTVDLVDVSGRRMRRVLDADRAAGTYGERLSLTDARGGPLSAGVYFLALRADREHATRRVVVLR